MSFLGAGEKVIEGVSAGLYACGTAIMASSQALVPVETGTLKRSGMVEQPVVEEDVVSVTVGYGYGEQYLAKATEGEQEDGLLSALRHPLAALKNRSHVTTGYGIYVEERDDTTHKPPTQAHFLRDAARAHADELDAFIAEGVRAKLTGEF